VALIYPLRTYWLDPSPFGSLRNRSLKPLPNVTREPPVKAPLSAASTLRDRAHLFKATTCRPGNCRAGAWFRLTRCVRQLSHMILILVLSLKDYRAGELERRTRAWRWRNAFLIHLTVPASR